MRTIMALISTTWQLRNLAERVLCWFLSMVEAHVPDNSNFVFKFLALQRKNFFHKKLCINIKNIGLLFKRKFKKTGRKNVSKRGTGKLAETLYNPTDYYMHGRSTRSAFPLLSSLSFKYHCKGRYYS